MAQNPQQKRILITALIGVAALVGVCIVLVIVLTVLGPALSPDFSTGGGSLADGGECAKAVPAFLAPGGGMDSLGSFKLSVPGSTITAQNAAGMVEMEQFTQAQSRLNETLAVDSVGEVQLYRVPEWPHKIAVANHDVSKLVIVEGYPSYSSIVRVCDVAAAKQLKSYPSDESTNAVAFTPDGARLVVNEGRGTIAIYDAETYLRAAHWDVRQGQQWRNTGHLAINPDGGLVAFGLVDRAGEAVKVSIAIWDIDANSQIAALEGHTDTLIDLVFSPNGSRLVSYSMDGTIRVWGIPKTQD